MAAVALTVANEPSRDPTVELVEAVHGKLQDINCCVVGSQDLCVLASELAGWVAGWLNT